MLCFKIFATYGPSDFQLTLYGDHFASFGMTDCIIPSYREAFQLLLHQYPSLDPASKAASIRDLLIGSSDSTLDIIISECLNAITDNYVRKADTPEENLSDFERKYLLPCYRFSDLSTDDATIHHLSLDNIMHYFPEDLPDEFRMGLLEALHCLELFDAEDTSQTAEIDAPNLLTITEILFTFLCDYPKEISLADNELLLDLLTYMYEAAQDTMQDDIPLFTLNDHFSPLTLRLLDDKGIVLAVENVDFDDDETHPSYEIQTFIDTEDLNLSDISTLWVLRRDPFSIYSTQDLVEADTVVADIATNDIKTAISTLNDASPETLPHCIDSVLRVFTSHRDTVLQDPIGAELRRVFLDKITAFKSVALLRMVLSYIPALEPIFKAEIQWRRFIQVSIYLDGSVVSSGSIGSVPGDGNCFSHSLLALKERQVTPHSLLQYVDSSKALRFLTASLCHRVLNVIGCGDVSNPEPVDETQTNIAGSILEQVEPIVIDSDDPFDSFLYAMGREIFEFFKQFCRQISEGKSPFILSQPHLSKAFMNFIYVDADGAMFLRSVFEPDSPFYWLNDRFTHPMYVSITSVPLSKNSLYCAYKTLFQRFIYGENSTRLFAPLFRAYVDDILVEESFYKLFLTELGTVFDGFGSFILNLDNVAHLTALIEVLKRSASSNPAMLESILAHLLHLSNKTSLKFGEITSAFKTGSAHWFAMPELLILKRYLPIDLIIEDPSPYRLFKCGELQNFADADAATIFMNDPNSFSIYYDANAAHFSPFFMAKNRSGQRRTASKACDFGPQTSNKRRRTRHFKPEDFKPPS